MSTNLFCTCAGIYLCILSYICKHILPCVFVGQGLALEVGVDKRRPSSGPCKYVANEGPRVPTAMRAGEAPIGPIYPIYLSSGQSTIVPKSPIKLFRVCS